MIMRQIERFGKTVADFCFLNIKVTLILSKLRIQKPTLSNRFLKKFWIPLGFIILSSSPSITYYLEIE